MVKWYLILSIVMPGGNVADFESVWLSFRDCRQAESDARQYVPVYESRCERRRVRIASR